MATDSTCSDAPPVKKFRLIGGDLSLDFTNTVGGKRGAITRECLNRYADLLSWFQQADVVNERQAKQLARDADRVPADAARALVRAIELREAIYQIFAATIAGRTPARTDLEALNSELSPALSRLRLGRTADGAGLGWTWAEGAGDLGAPLGPVARAAAELLTDEHALRQVRQCGGGNCGWLFLDSSKNHSRRWCDMRDCGNRAKVRRHRLKERRAGA